MVPRSARRAGHRQCPRRARQNNGQLTFDVHYTEGSDIGYKRYEVNDLKPAFWFGHGLSYTTFDYSEFSASQDNGTVRIRFTVTNSGPVTGTDVPQIYATLPDTSQERARRLVQWSRLSLAAGQSRTVELVVDDKHLSIWDTAAKQWSRPIGEYGLHLGASAADLRLTTTLYLDKPQSAAR
ncbi:fibronectin type III-like domain-contianing protein [Streptomyces shenzhenensis]